MQPATKAPSSGGLAGEARGFAGWRGDARHAARRSGGEDQPIVLGDAQPVFASVVSDHELAAWAEEIARCRPWRGRRRRGRTGRRTRLKRVGHPSMIMILIH